ncbi:MAG: DUF268 domain-containing protein [Planctomycetia bacterium]
MAIPRAVVHAWLSVTSMWNGLCTGRWPPAEVPEELRSAYTMSGTIPLMRWYLNDVKSGALVWTPRSRWWKPEKVRQRGLSYYGSTDTFLYQAIKQHPVDGLSVVIVGSEFPWYECIATGFGAAVTTIEYRSVECHIPGLRVLTPDEFARQPRRFDAVISISSIEHDGLGRYGDPLNPDGDLRAMEQFRHLLNPGGKLFLSVPVGPDVVVWNAHRIYGPLRLPRLFAGWKQLAAFGFDEARLVKGRRGDYSRQPVFVLEPTDC